MQTCLLGMTPLLVEADASFCGDVNSTCADDAGTRCYCDVDWADSECLCAPGYHLPQNTDDSTAVCQREFTPTSLSIEYRSRPGYSIKHSD